MRNMRLKHQAGASLVHWLIALIPLMGVGAFAIDLNNVYVSLAQLQTAADAGALEGARLLYVRDPVTNNLVINTSADNAADAATKANLVQGGVLNEVTVSRGHWTFMTNTPNPADPPSDPFERGGRFFANPSTTILPLTNPDGSYKTFQNLNNDVAHINAVEVVAARNLNPVQAFFGRLLGINGYQAQATAVAYVGFAGTVEALEFDMPIAMCDDVLDLANGCNVGRLVPEPGQTAGWTNLNATYDGSCAGAADANELRTLVSQSKVCPNGGGVNAQEITLGGEIPVNNGQVNTAFDEMYDCWKNNAALDTLPPPSVDNPGGGDGWPDQPMEWFLPVVNGCSFGGACAQVIGGVRVEVLWMFLNVPGESGGNSIHDTGPRHMGDWSSDGLPDPSDGVARWNDFVDHFNLEMDGNHTEATYANGGAIQKTIYFKPSCDPVELGGTGGANYGVLSEIPVLVR